MIIPVGFGQATIIYAGTQVPTGAVNTFGFANTGGASPLICATAIELIWSTNIMPVLNDDVELSDILIKLGPNATGPTATSGPGDPGGDVGPGATPQVAYLVQKHTGLGGRKGRGRWFIPGVDEESVDQQGLVAAGMVTALQTGVGDTLTDLGTADLPMALLHNDATTPTLVTDLIVSQTVATIRKRVRR